MATIGTATVNIVPSMQGFTSKVSKGISGINLSSTGKKLGSSLSDGMGSALSGGGAAMAGIFGGIASSAFSAITGAIGNLMGQMVEAADGAQKFASTLEFAGVDTSTIDALTKSTQAYADQTVYDLNDIRNVTAQLAANGVSNYAQLAEAAGNLNAVAGGNASTFQSVGQVMTQTAGAGKLMTENWNQLTDAIPGASGALQQAMMDAGAFEGNFREAMENGEISADEFFAAVQKLGMQDVAREAATSTSTIEGALGNLQASVVGVGSQVVSALTPMLTGAMTQIASFISGIPMALAPVGQAIMTALSGGGTEGITVAIGQLVTNISTGLVQAMTGFAAQLPAIMQAVVPTIVTAITSLVTSLMTNLPSILMSTIGMVITAITSFASSIAAMIPQVVPQLASAGMAAVNDLVMQVLTQLPTYVGQMVDAALQLFHGIVDALPETIPLVVDGITELVHNVLTHLPSFLGQMIDAAVELFTGIVDAIPEVVPAVLEGVGQLLQNIWNEITSFDLVGAGKDLIQGLIDGIASMGGAVLDAIGGVVSSAIDWAKNMLGIASPSKVFREIGDYTMQGFARGIKGGTSYATKAMDDAMHEVLGKAGGSIGVSGTDAGISTMGGLAGAQAVVNQTINFNQPIQTPSQVARTMKRYATYGLAGAR